ncbi:cyclin-like protein [Scheffersomyces coipomensis]|uniref:cyclin-like protein n=1 Tax=Scheffersomyces coipomensis TaxID=1788519 RepID=UPI00315D1569
MRSFKPKSITDENVTKNTTTRVKPTTSTSSSSSTLLNLSGPAPIKSKSIDHQRPSSGTYQREVLGELNHNTLNNNINNTSKVKSVTPQVGTSSTASRIQIYKQYHQQFKKPRLEKIRKNQQSQTQPSNIDLDADVTDYDENEEEEDNEDADKENKYFIEEEDDDEELDLLLINENEGKETSTAGHKHDIPHQIEHPSSLVEHSDDIPHHFDKLNEEDEIVDLSQDDDEDDVEEEEERQQQQQQIRNTHIPMEPIWNARISQELHTIMRKFAHTVLDENDEDTFDVTMVAEYSPEIFNYLRELENKLSPDPMYMENQDELKWEMRSVLIDWVVQVHNRFNLLPETLYLTVNYIDRFLSKRKVSLSRFQLVGAVALFIAAKYEEINCPTVQEVAYMADNAYSIEDFLKAERFMIDVLEFDMGWPGPMSFLRRTSKADDYDYETRTLAKYFLEITIMDSKFVASPPSWLAAGSHYLSRKLLNRGDWTEAHIFYSGYTEIQLKPLAEILLESCRDAETHHKAIFEKYQERRYRRSSTFVQEYFTSLQED